MRDPKQVYPVSTQKTIERRIEGKETIIKEKGKVIDNSKFIISELNNGLSDLKTQLDLVKNARDTSNIVQIQDTMIHTLYLRDKEKDLIINSQDTIINAQRYIINSKDTIISALKSDVKKIKKQRNLSLILNGILAGTLILKK
jgi:pantothenate kinase